MKRFEKLLALMLFAALMLLPAALAEDAEIEELPEFVGFVDMPLDSDEALDGYIQSRLGIGGSGLMAARSVGNELTGTEKKMYDELSTKIASVASGKTASTVFSIKVEDLSIPGNNYTAESLGVTSLYKSNSRTLTDEAMDALKAKLCDSTILNRISRCLVWDHPYELYWFDKTYSNGPVTVTLPSIVKYPNSVAWSNSSSIKFSFRVASAYAGSSDYTVNTTKTGATTAAVNTAKSIVSDYRSASDYDKLVGYKERICALTSYNTAALTSTTYGDPWQLIYVFDGDSSTNVVCEGYAKAFQYLCDMTTFQDNASVVCYCVTGTIDGQAHMWNIVHMPNGKNYHVDVTNCDGSGVGAPDKLFMVGCTNGSPSAGYTFSLKRNVPYTYAEDTRALFSNSELTLSAQSYLEDIASGTTITDEATLPADLKTIGARAFRGISAQRLVIPSGCTTIGAQAFANCSNLVEVRIPASVTSIANDAFSGCPSTLRIIAPDGSYARTWAANNGIINTAQ